MRTLQHIKTLEDLAFEVHILLEDPAYFRWFAAQLRQSRALASKLVSPKKTVSPIRDRTKATKLRSDPNHGLSSEEQLTWNACLLLGLHELFLDHDLQQRLLNSREARLCISFLFLDVSLFLLLLKGNLLRKDLDDSFLLFVSLQIFPLLRF